jgi:hypothetical protein
LDSFPSAGTCFAEYLCFSIGKLGVAKIGDKPELSQDQFDGLAREIFSVPQITFDQSNHDTVLNGLKKTYNGAVLEVVAPPGTMSSEVLIGMAFLPGSASLLTSHCSASTLGRINGAMLT